MSSLVRGLLPIPGSSIIVRNIGSDLLSRRDISIKLLSYNILKMFCLISNIFLVSSKLLRSYSRLMVATPDLGRAFSSISNEIWVEHVRNIPIFGRNFLNISPRPGLIPFACDQIGVYLCGLV